MYLLALFVSPRYHFEASRPLSLSPSSPYFFSFTKSGGEKDYATGLTCGQTRGITNNRRGEDAGSYPQVIFNS